MSKVISTIAVPADYNDPARDIVRYSFSVHSGEYKESLRDARQNQSTRVAPATGCVVVLDDSSISLSSLYELSGLRLTPELSMTSGVASAFGYCERSSVDQARIDFMSLAQTRLSQEIKSLKNALKKTEESLLTVYEKM